METISIVVPVYNAKKTINRCIDSLIHQTYEKLEIILVDDGSTDGSGAICDEYVKQDQRIIVVHKQNAGVSAARNTGIQKATGSYLQFVDSDDYLEQNACEILVNAMEENKSQMVICGCVEHRGETKKKIMPNLEGNIKLQDIGKRFGELYISNLLNIPWNKLFLREKIEKNFDINISLGEDLLFNIEYMKKVNDITFLNEILYHYIIEQNSLSRSLRENYIELSLFLHKQIIDFCEKKIVGEYGKERIDAYFMISFLRGIGIMINAEDKSEQEKKIILKNWLGNNNICEIVRGASTNSKLKKICKKMIVYHRYKTLYYILKLKKIIKK